MNKRMNDETARFRITVVDRTDEWAPDSATALMPTQCIPAPLRAEAPLATGCITAVPAAPSG